MAKNEVQGNIYPTVLYVAKDIEGNIHWYEKDPMRSADRKNDEVNVGDLVMAFAGEGTIANPICVRLNVAYINRAVEFAISQPEAIRLGRIAGHFEDLNGHIVEILSQANKDPEFPLNGVLFDQDGTIVRTATFNNYGECSDGNPDHSIVMLPGVSECKTEE